MFVFDQLVFLLHPEFAVDPVLKSCESKGGWVQLKSAERVFQNTNKNLFLFRQSKFKLMKIRQFCDL